MTEFEIPAAFAGEYVRCDEPDWEPLSRLAGGEALILDQFMWMGGVRLSDGRMVQAYKHFETRCYLHLADDLTPFEYRGGDSESYLTSTLGIALREVFCLCRELGRPEEAELRANEALIERHSRYPRVG